VDRRVKVILFWVVVLACLVLSYVRRLAQQLTMGVNSIFVPHGNTEAPLVTWAIGVVAIAAFFLYKLLKK
jgi:hypothetical protein